MTLQTEVYGILTVVSYVIGLLLAVVALWRSRTPQGATAWVVGLLGFPFLAVPAFLVFGRNRFFGYVKERKELEGQALKEAVEAQSLYDWQVSAPEPLKALNTIANRARQPGFTNGNSIQLLINADQTYTSMIEAIQTAQKYVLFQFYIFREDEAGARFKEALIQKALAGVKIYFLSDQIGTSLGSRWIREMKAAGIEVLSFESTKRWFSHFQINFRNHRKVIVVDGKTAFVGGLNIGNDYLGLWKSIGSWRDSHVRLEGPSALSVQTSFMKDWYWAKEEVPDLNWTAHKTPQDSSVLALHTGPADESEVCLLAHLALILSARRQVWISNPYFVPAEGLSNALSLASLRGVDVRILVPSLSDSLLVSLASKPHIERLLHSGVRFYRYNAGFLHQKVLLIDEEVGIVGSANLDSRSFFINFEVMAISNDAHFAKSLKAALEKDFEVSEKITVEDFENQPFWRKLISRAANLLSPMI